MGQIICKKRGISLIELIVYMSIFSMIFVMLMSSVFYIQKIIQVNNQNYYIKNQIYENLNILQQYLLTSHIRIVDQSLRFFDKNGTLMLMEKLDQNKMIHVYPNKTIAVLEHAGIQTYKVELQDKGRVLKIGFTWLDQRGKTQTLTEYLIVINQNL